MRRRAAQDIRGAFARDGAAGSYRGQARRIPQAAMPVPIWQATPVPPSPQ